ncbi:MAG: 3-hydroxyacyl-CoA dehydrogenase NAD-binding domain-containing protein, partial [Deltaproteobacteria bacterium]
MAVARTDTPVLLVRTTPGDTSRAIRRSESRRRFCLDAEEMTEEEVVRARGRVRVVPDLSMLSCCDLVIEAVSGDDRARRAVLATLESSLSPGAVLATNSPTEHLAAIAEVLRRRDQFVGLSFFSGAAADPPPRRGARPSLPSKRLVELGLLAETAPGVAAACRAFALSLG